MVSARHARQACKMTFALPILVRALIGQPLTIPIFHLDIDDRLLVAYAVSVVLAGGFHLWKSLTSDDWQLLDEHNLMEDNSGDEVPIHACYYCVKRVGDSKCGGCRLVFYCGRICQLQAWRKHRHVCGAAATAIARIQRPSQPITPSQWRTLSQYTQHVQTLLKPVGIIPCNANVAARVLIQIAAYIRENPELLRQEIADGVWAAAVSMRSNGIKDRMHMAWAWVFLEGSVESGSPDAILAAMGLQQGGDMDNTRVNRWMCRGLYQSLLMLTRRSEVLDFVKATPRVAGR